MAVCTARLRKAHIILELSFLSVNTARFSYIVAPIVCGLSTLVMDFKIIYRP